jgi:HicB family
MAPIAQRGEAAPRAPDDQASHSGRLLLRMPQSLHAELARAAEREGVSLNAFITNVLSGAVAWRSPDEHRGPGRVVRIAVLVDLVLVTIAALLAVALLVVAWP